jgi:Gpi18-like mannosyltransferase
MISVKSVSKQITKVAGNYFLFPFSIWLASRLIMWLAMLLVAPIIPPEAGKAAVSLDWGVFDSWDSIHYKAIATSGYEYANGVGNVVFFPLYPLIIRGLVSLGLPLQPAGVIVNNLAFLGFLQVLYSWVKHNQSENTARWTVATAALFPTSMFAGAIYTEGLYLLLSTAALRAFDRNQYLQTALWGALATASRPTGMALIPAFLLAAWKERKPPLAYVAAFATGLGLLCFSIYCAVQYGDILAFIHAQKSWRPNFGFYWQGWWKMLMQICIGTYNYRKGYIKDPSHPIIFIAIAICIGLLWRNRHKFSPVKVDYGFGILFLGLWLLAGDPLINTVSVLGSAYILWLCRRELTSVAFLYGFCGIALLLASGGTMSLSRLVYGIVPPIVAFGIILSRHPRWGYMSLGFFALLLFTFSLRFAQELWVG